MERNWIGIMGKLISENFDCTLVNIYNPCNNSARAEVWEKLIEFCSQSHLPCLILGDFNEVLGEQDRGIRNIDISGTSEFQSFIQDLNLIEIQALNGWFTWFRGNSQSKLDRLLIQPEWVSVYPSLQVSILNRNISDHCPLLIHSQNIK